MLSHLRQRRRRSPRPACRFNAPIRPCLPGEPRGAAGGNALNLKSLILALRKTQSGRCARHQPIRTDQTRRRRGCSAAGSGRVVVVPVGGLNCARPCDGSVTTVAGFKPRQPVSPSGQILGGRMGSSRRRRTHHHGGAKRRASGLGDRGASEATGPGDDLPERRIEPAVRRCSLGQRQGGESGTTFSRVRLREPGGRTDGDPRRDTTAGAD